MLSRILYLSILMLNCWRVEPFWNWDLVGYVGVAQSYRYSGDAVHQQTYALLREKVPADRYREMTKGGGYAETVATDPESFRQQLPFYSVKPLYPALMVALGRP